ncbi:MAG: DUF262 domain-containing HNH endonuclease family protein [Candidatus Obscuribacterales bacterium]|nr:DUF262 domain-containing HNH endonuclease family protein [Candidatus Obscuribacterales bacterium]
MTTKQTEMKSELQSAGTILKTDVRYKVPPHQRNFSWTLDEVKQLWDDLLDAIQEDRPEYFLGTIVVQEDPENKCRTIIDGQQRLATLTMILSGIRTVYKEHNDERAEEVYTDYLGVKDRRTRITEPRLALNVTNEPVFQSMVVEDASDENLSSSVKNKPNVSSNLLICVAMQFLRAAIRDKSTADKKYETFLLELEDFVRDRVVMVLMLVRDEADAYLIFETLNDRGLDLSTSDLLKNYILGKAGNRLETVRKQWEEMVFLLGAQNETQFLRHYWLSKYGVIRELHLYKEMKQRFSNQNRVLELIEELRDAADKYTAMSNVDHTFWKGYSTALRRDLETLQLFGISQFRPLLLAAMEKMKEDHIEKLVRIIVVLSMRYSIIGTLGTGNIEKAYSDAAVEIRSGKSNTPAKVFSLLKPIYPDDTKFEADFFQRAIGKAKLARYILGELAASKQASTIQVVTEDEKKSTLEHIMPKTRSQDWLKAAKDEAEYLEYVDRLGNLTLIEREKNKAAANAAFTRKKVEAYSQSELLLTKELCKYPDWTISDIQSRQAQLAKLAVQIWALPYS